MITSGFEIATNLTEASIMAALESTDQHRVPTENLFAQSLLDNIRDGVIFVDGNNRIQTWNQATEIMTGISSGHAIGQPISPSIFNLTDADGREVSDQECPFVACIRNGKKQQSEFRIVGRSGREVKAEFNIVPIRTYDGTICGAVILIQDSSVQLDLKRQLKDLYTMSMLDPLTQVANRSEFERVLDEYVRAHNLTDFQCSLIICDIDFFKQINDNYGHNVGDQALVAFAQLLKKFVRGQDVVARYGGEEFVILCANCNIEAAVERAEEIRSTLTKTPQQMLNGKCITASFGVSQLKRSDSATDFFVRADQGLLNAKETGRNRVVAACSSDDSPITLQDAETKSLAGVKWRKQKGQPLFCEEFKTSTPLPVVIESLRGYILEMGAEVRKVEPDYASVKIQATDPNSNVKGSFIVDVELMEAVDEDQNLVGERRATFIRITIKGGKNGWFFSNSSELAPAVMTELRRYLMITDESARLTVAPAATEPSQR